jgi:hypothetical protein
MCIVHAVRATHARNATSIASAGLPVTRKVGAKKGRSPRLVVL